MDITVSGSPLDYSPSDDQLSRTSIELAAMDGEVGNGVFPFTDTAGSLIVHSGRQVRFDEGGTLISNGFFVDQDRSKGFQPAGPSVEHGYGLLDANALLHGFRYERTRPAETGYARVMASMGDLPVGTLTDFVESSDEYTMPAKVYATDDGWDELITDLVEFTGKVLFLHDTADGDRCLHYHVLTSGHTAGLNISDVIGEYDGVTVFNPQQAVRQLTSVDLINDIKGRDQAERTSSATDATSIAAHDADGLRHQTLRDFEAGSQADLDRKVNVFLLNQKNEQANYSCVIGPLDEDSLALIRVGDQVTVTSSVMLLTEDPVRISHMTLTPYIGANGRARVGWWMAALEMGAPKRRRSRGKPTLSGVIINDPTGGDGSGTGDCCTPWACDTNVVGGLSCLGHDGNSYSFTEGGTRSGLGPGIPNVGSGNYEYTSTDFVHYWRVGVGASEYPHAGQTGDWGNGGVCEGIFTDGIVDYNPGGGIVRLTVIGPGEMTIHTSAHPGGMAGACPGGSAGDITASVVVSGVGGAPIVTETQPAGTNIVITVPDDGECAHFIDIRSVGALPWGYGGANWTPNMTGLPPCANGLPDPGQPVDDNGVETTTGDGVTTTDTIGHADKFGYVAGSLVIAVNGLQPWPGVHEVDPDAGTLIYDYPPPLGSDVKRLYDRGELVP